MLHYLGDYKHSVEFVEIYTEYVVLEGNLSAKRTSDEIQRNIKLCIKFNSLFTVRN
jgi:hypothetical protein